MSSNAIAQKAVPVKNLSALSVRQTGSLLIAIAVLLVLIKPWLPEVLIRLPISLVMPFADIINGLFLFVKDDLGFIHVTRAIAGAVESLLDVTANLLYGKRRWPYIGPIPWITVAVTAGCVGYALGGPRLALLGAGTFVWAALLGQWRPCP